MLARRQKGFTIIELLVVVAIITIIAAVAIPKLRAVQMTAYEMAAIRALQTLNTAQLRYSSTYGRFASTLMELGPAPRGTGPSASRADLISEDLAQGLKSSYVFTMVGTPSGYSVNADPQVYGVKGTRSFYTDHTNIVRQHVGNEPASETDPEIK